MRQPRSRQFLTRLTEQDRAVWSSYVAEFSTRPRRAAPSPPPAPTPPVERATTAPPVPVPAKRPPHAALIIGRAPAGLDASSSKRLAEGGMKAQRRLDLHGLTLQMAFDRFASTLSATAGGGIRCLEVITGRGSGEAGGALRRELPLWLNRPDLRPFILAAAHPHRCNDGSVLLLLRRRPR